jgi:16S rRNA (cytidine1402-2'-O)-methyltransferase
MPQLVLVPTPIGNLDDITLRAIKVLQSAQVIYAEDTRTSGMLLKHLGIDKPLRSLHQHNEHQRLAVALAEISTLDQVAYISDAGTPGISDPGFLLVRACIQAGIQVHTLPGPTAFVPALVCSGLPSDRFIFEGFLPHKKGRLTRLQALVNEQRTIVFYESPFRLIKLLEQCIINFGENRLVCVSREISKIYEEHKRGTLVEVLQYFNAKGVKGELVVCVAGCGYYQATEIFSEPDQQ